jgi:uncharacterized membrane protein
MFSREGFREYASGALWVWPSIASLGALITGSVMGQIIISPRSPLAPLAFQGTADDARSLLTTISSTVVTVIALVLGLTVVALQLASTQFSPRLLRNFLRDRSTQVVLSVFMATFVYSTAGLFTVGVSEGSRTEEYPRLAVSIAMVLLFASLAMVVYFADHLAHSIQIDAVTTRAELGALKVAERLPGTSEEAPPKPPPWAVPLAALRSGYIQTAHPEALLPLASQYGVTVAVRHRVGEHVITGTTIASMWRPAAADPAPDAAMFSRAIDEAVKIGFERTLQQDITFGMRQLVDVACKALSPAINDPYTAVQAIDHLSVIFCAMATRPLGDDVARDTKGRGMVLVPGRRFGDLLAVMCGMIRRYGGAEPIACLALLRLLSSCAALIGDDPARREAIEKQVALIVLDAEHKITQPDDVVAVRAAAEAIGYSAPAEVQEAPKPAPG